MYREAVGSLINLVICTIPDLSFVVSKLSQYFAEPTEEHWLTVNHVLRYLKGTSEKGLCFQRSDEKLGIHAYCDADWVSDVSGKRSTTGYCVRLNKNNSPGASWEHIYIFFILLFFCQSWKQLNLNLLHALVEHISACVFQSLSLAI